jgi:hypothetical protein
MSEVQSTTTIEVEYRDILGFPGYRVGSDGSVWSCRTSASAGNGFTHKWRRLKERRDRYSYLTLCAEKKRYLKTVHRLVIEAFIGPCPPGMECCHNDGDGFNNSLDNLRWDDRKSNQHDRIAHGTDLRGECHPMAKTTEVVVREIRAAREAGASFHSLSKKYRMSRPNIKRIALRKIWRHVT